jgi:hypothetical protein
VVLQPAPIIASGTSPQQLFGFGVRRDIAVRRPVRMSPTERVGALFHDHRNFVLAAHKAGPAILTFLF